MTTKHYGTLKHDVWLPYRLSVGPFFYKFYEGLKDKKILGNVCPKCKKVLVPARSFCPECHVDMGDYKEVGQAGEIISWTLARHPVYGLELNPPFVPALIRLDGAGCDLLHIVGGVDLNDPDVLKGKIKSGTRVKAVWNSERQGHMLDIRYFQPE
jgi:uncharacterized protein